jgi:hypothetical protein
VALETVENAFDAEDEPFLERHVVGGEDRLGERREAASSMIERTHGAIVGTYLFVRADRQALRFARSAG